MSSLFQPLNLGPVSLKHRVVFAPLTRFKVDAHHVPLLPLVKDYYTQRGSTQGTLLIAESTIIAPKAGGYPMPGIWTQNQINAWKEVTDSVHSKGSFIFLQLLALGRAALPDVLKAEDPAFSVVSASDVPITPDGEKPRPLTVDEIGEYTQLYAQAAKNAIAAGFDGVEIHCNNGCLLDQFLQDVTNKRTDDYGGSVENRARFPLEVVKAVTEAIGEERTGIRLSPWSLYAGMGMADPLPTFSHLVSEIKRAHPQFAYLSLIEPRINADSGVEPTPENAAQSNDVLCDIWGADRALICAGGHTRASAMQLADRRANTLVAFGRQFLANPDLPLRLEKGVPLNPYDRSTFYLPMLDEPRGYTDYPFASEA